MALFQEVDYHQMTMEGVAARARVGKSTVYRWWSTKASLVIDAVDVALTAMRQGPIEVTGDSATVVRELVRRIVEAVASPAGRMIAAVSGDLRNDLAGQRQLAAMLGPHRAAGSSIVYALISRGDLPHDLDADLMLDLIAGTVLSRILLGRHPTPALVDQLTDLVLEGRLPRLSS
ncbi:TetR family transcriptional regulator [Pseudonocardia asaccharolytica DSM 44247 = NBRC 16224]|uniref:TetR family transcriptional regulator n=2 Tax=Pseudonocardia asaccharolytica TaxID=54010 RepID=A0A511CWF4_9PSEU|nr:TetR family transcriptional regulator [Pseudonocardia asaccharolytica DSM 44247 = NBRC 16224]